MEAEIHQRIHARSDGRQEPAALGCKQDPKRANDGKAQHLSQSPRRPFIQNYPMRADFEGKADRFALSWPKRSTNYLGAYWLCEGAFADPRRQSHRRSYLSNNGGWNQYCGKKTFQQVKMANLLQRN